jgi:hypothetical protein
LQTYYLMAMTNPAVGREADYNEWFEKVHIPQVLRTSGFKSARRLALTTEQRMPAPYPYQFATLYEIETDDLQVSLDALGETIKTSTKTDTSDPARRAIWVFRSLGEFPR